MIFVLMMLAVARVTRFITRDAIFEVPRNWVIRHLINPIEAPGIPTMQDGIKAKLAYLIVCDWCSSIYVGAAAACAYAVWGDTLLFTAVCAALAASYVTGFLAAITERGD